MKPREPRRAVALPARMRTDDGWIDVKIRNISPHGMGLQSLSPPKRGDYVEIFRLSQRVVGRVAWSDGARFGLRAQDVIAVEAMVAGRTQERDAKVAEPAERRANAREPASAARTAADLAAQLERSRRFSSAFDYGAVAFGAAVAAMLLAGTISHALSVPMESVVKHL